MEPSVLIVGAGLGGLAAAIEARSRGGAPVVLEKLPPPERWNAVSLLPGGTGNDTFRSGGGGLARFSGDALVEHLLDGPGQLESGRSPIDILLERHMRLGWGEIDQALLRTYCSRVFADCCWLRDEVGVPYDETGRTVKDLGIGLFKSLYRAAQARGVQFVFDTRARHLLTESGRLCGVLGERSGERLRFEAGAVVLATGGFQGNRDLLMQHVDRELVRNVEIVGSPDNTGDGLAMARSLGAKLRHLGVCHIRTTDLYFGQGPSRYLAHIYPLGIYFNERFERFVDEGVSDSDTIANAIAYQPGNRAGLLFDDKARLRHAVEYDKYPRREQLVRSAGSIEELAGKLHVDPQGLKKLVEEFNAAVKSGKPPPGVPKTMSAVPIDTAPFHGFYPVRPAINHTLGGVAVDARTCQVLDEDGNGIRGLYAAGTVLNWAYGRSFEVGGVTSYRGSYHAGASSGAGMALVSGRLAGEQAVRASAGT